MRSVSPRLGDAEEFDIAEDQHEFLPVRACIIKFEDGTRARVIRYTLTDDERAKIARGEDLYFGTPPQLMLIPHWIVVGSPLEP
jgi:hypothetical protein